MALPPLIRKNLTNRSISNKIAELKFSLQTGVDITQDIAEVFLINLRNLLFSSYDGLPFLRNLGVDLNGYIFSLQYDFSDFERRLIDVFSQSSLFEFQSLDDMSFDGHEVHIVFTVKFVPADKLFSVELKGNSPNGLQVQNFSVV